ncbi:MAG: hypothetical protein R8P61_24455 [Bacteroidia bacterium]|nr:hypothetical protein [Bacteroidia bacterium]
MQRFLIAFLLIFSSLQLAAQNGRYASLEDFPEVKSSTLLVVLYEDDDTYNDKIKEIIESHWTFTPYQFVDTTELYEISKNKGDKEYSMLVRNNSHRLVRRVSGTDKIQNNHLALYLMDTGTDLRNYTGKDALTHFQLNDVRNTMEYFHKLPAFIKYMQLYLKHVEEKNPTEDTHGKLLRAFNSENTQKLKDYTLLMDKEEVGDFMSQEEIAEIYGHKVELVEAAVIMAAVHNEEEQKAFLHLDPRIKQMTIMDAATGEVLYLERTDTSGELNKADFKKLGRAALGDVDKPSKKLKDRIRRFNRSKKTGN